MVIHLNDKKILNQWQEVVEILAKVVQVPSAIITRVQPPNQVEVFKASRNPDNPYKEGMSVEMAGHYCEHVIRTKNRLKLADATKEDEWKNAPELKYGVVSYLGYPILMPSGEVFGTICVLDKKENEYQPEYEKLLEQFRVMVQDQLEIFEQNRELEKQLREIKTLRGILPICASCKKIRKDDGYWEQVESYVHRHSDADFSHSLCPDCYKKYDLED